MHSKPVAAHLRELSKVARDLEGEADTPKSRRVMKKLAADYDAWAALVERSENGRRELELHIERCKVVLAATENVVCRAVLEDLIRYLEKWPAAMG